MYATRNIVFPGRTGNYSGPQGTIWRNSLLVLMFFLTIRSAAGQDFVETDSSTYRLYEEKNWKELIAAGKSALKHGIDYYYLRMRLGIAYYEKTNYKSAQIHFRKALEFNEADPVALEYLYFSYLFGGQAQQAALLYDGFTDPLKKRIADPGLRSIDRVSLEYLYNKTNTNGLVSDPETFEDLYGIRIITRAYHNQNLALTHFMHPGLSFTHSFTSLQKENYYAYDDGTIWFRIDGQKVIQYQYYLSPSFTTGRGLVISPLFHYLHVDFEVLTPVFSNPGPGGPGGSTLPGTTTPTGLVVNVSEDSDNQLVGGLALSKFQGRFSYRVSTLYSNLNNADQFTGGVGLTWYPRGNLDFYLGTSCNMHWENLSDEAPSYIQDLVLGYGIASKVWVEISGAGGRMKNYTESNGYVVYNGLDWMKYRILGNVIVPLTAKGSTIYAGARYAGYGSSEISFSSVPGGNTNNIDYKSLSIFGGISWKF